MSNIYISHHYIIQYVCFLQLERINGRNLSFISGTVLLDSDDSDPISCSVESLHLFTNIRTMTNVITVTEMIDRATIIYINSLSVKNSSLNVFVSIGADIFGLVLVIIEITVASGSRVTMPSSTPGVEFVGVVWATVLGVVWVEL